MRTQCHFSKVIKPIKKSNKQERQNTTPKGLDKAAVTKIL